MRIRFSLAVAITALIILTGTRAASSQMATPHGSIPSTPVDLVNGTFECPDYVDGQDERGRRIRIPVGWTLQNSAGETPVVYSAREWFAGSCGGDAFIERQEGEDSVVLRAQDLETPPEPGKPFDTTLIQQVAVEPDGAYSVSGWFLSLCGGSFAEPNDCPDGYYMAKLLGLDPTGASDPLAESVTWVENRDNFVEPDGRTRIGWQNLRLAATAETDVMTVLARIHSPFQWHGNHAFIDAVKIVRAPAAMFGALPQQVAGTTLSVPWLSEQSPDVAAIPGGTYRLYIDVQVRPEGGEWRDLLVDGPESGQLDFGARCLNTTYEFRIRARAEQPPVEQAGEGARPNHRFPGVWSEAVPVYFAAPAVQQQLHGAIISTSYLPIIFANTDC